MIRESEKKLLKLLQHDARTSIVTLAERIGKSRNWVARTIKSLVKKRIIRSYTSILDPSQVYVERNTILLLKTNPRELGVSESLLDMPELESLDGVSGNYSLLGLLRFRSSRAFELFLDRIDKIVAGSGARIYNLVQVLTTYKTAGFEIERRGIREGNLSNTDWNLIGVLARYQPTPERPLPLTQREIGERMQPSLSQPAVSKAMRRLEENQTVIGYSIDIDFKHINLPIKFFLQVKAKPGRVAEAAKTMSLMDEVWDLHRVGEDYGLFATVRTCDVESYNRFIRRLYENEDVEDTQSQISLEEWYVPVHQEDYFR